MTSATERVQSVVADALAEMRDNANAVNVEGMARFGIASEGTLGVSMVLVRALARRIKQELGRDAEARHAAAALLWDSGVHEARILAALVDAPSLVDESQIESWVVAIDSWDVCDQLCGNLFDKTSFAWDKAVEWSGRDEEFVKRAGFVLMTQLAVHDKKAADERFLAFLPIIEREVCDERNFVKKAINWALRQIGKRSSALNGAAIASAERILELHPACSSARWIARDALRELRSDAVRERLGLE